MDLIIIKSGWGNWWQGSVVRDGVVEVGEDGRR